MLTRRTAIVATARTLVGTAWYLGQGSPAAPAAKGPGTRGGHALAYHAGAGAICLLGGDSEQVDVTREDPLVLEWARVGPASSRPGACGDVARGPPPRESQERQSVLAFGGFTVLGHHKYGPPADDLWELDSNLTWRQIAVQGAAAWAATPPRRANFSIPAAAGSSSMAGSSTDRTDG